MERLMTQDEIIEMGIKADLCDEHGDINWEYKYLDEIIAFANLVAQHEREACAKIADEWAVGWPHPSTVIAERIRARKHA